MKSRCGWLECLLFFVFPLESMLRNVTREKNWRCHIILHAALSRERFIDLRKVFVASESGSCGQLARGWRKIISINAMCHIYRCMEKSGKWQGEQNRRELSPFLWSSRLEPLQSANMIFSLCASQTLFHCQQQQGAASNYSEPFQEPSSFHEPQVVYLNFISCWSSSEITWKN